MLTALRAGNNPANVPAITNVSVAWMAIPMSTVGFRNTVSDHIPLSIVWFPKALFIHSVAPMPATIPIYPNMVVIVTLSTIISQRNRKRFGSERFADAKFSGTLFNGNQHNVRNSDNSA